MQPAYGPAIKKTKATTTRRLRRAVVAGNILPAHAAPGLLLSYLAAAMRSATIFGVMKTSSSVFALSRPWVLNR